MSSSLNGLSRAITIPATSPCRIGTIGSRVAIPKIPRAVRLAVKSNAIMFLKAKKRPAAYTAYIPILDIALYCEGSILCFNSLVRITLNMPPAKKVNIIVNRNSINVAGVISPIIWLAMAFYSTQGVFKVLDFKPLNSKFFKPLACCILAMNKLNFVLVAALALIVACMNIGIDTFEFEDACDDIERVSEKNNCYAELAIELKHSEPCSFIEDNSMLEDSCFAEVSISSVDRLGCNEIEDEKVRSYCQAKIGIVRKEVAICDNIDNADWRDTCLYGVANATQKAEICHSIVRDATSDNCFDNLAKQTGYGANCAYISDLEIKNRCFITVAGATGNESLCNEITIQESRWTCFQRIAKLKLNANICSLIDSKDVVELCRLSVNEAILSSNSS